MNREFLDPGRKLVDETADWLCGSDRYDPKTRETPEGARSLAHVLVVVPTAQSGRNLRLAVARRFEGNAVIPPRIVQPSQLIVPKNPFLREASSLSRRVAADYPPPEGNAALPALFRRMAFNVLAWNCDDHVKNIAYLMDRRGEWRLAPAYDMCFAYNQGGDWTSRHQMAVNGKRIGITDDDLLAMAQFANMRERKARAVLDEIKDAVRAWPRFAAEAEVSDEFVTEIGTLLDGRLQMGASA